MTDALLNRLRDNDPLAMAGVAPGSALSELAAQGVRMAATGGPLEEVWHRALGDLAACIHPGDGGPEVLHEGGVYRGTWLESTGTINAEVLGRFLPAVARDTYLLFADRVRADGLLPYKVTEAGPSYRQIQIVTPLARSVWHHHRLHPDPAFLRRMYDAMVRNDGWLAAHRDTRGSGCVEAFCAFDTGHDLSPRFWHVPDTTHHEDPAAYHPDSPILPFLAPDLTANVACQRDYLARIAATLGEDPQPWRHARERSVAALYAHCFDESDAMFYDRDRTGQLVRVQSDVLLRVLACEIGDEEFFETSLRRYLLNTRKFFARFPFTSIALDDPRFSQDFSRNSWAGPSNFLTLLRAPHAFEHHGHHVELTWALNPVLAAVCRMTRFPQTLNPWTGEQGFTEQYSPAILWTLDAVERLAGILPRPDGEVWCTALLPYGVDHQPVTDAVGYARTIGSSTYEFIHDEQTAVLHRDGAVHATFPPGARLVLDPSGAVRAVVGVSARTVTGTLVTAGYRVELTLAGNERLELDPRGAVTAHARVPVVPPAS
jgi:Mannosylglycerate hydrolase MGH1-like glycoside hydrolase domain